MKQSAEEAFVFVMSEIDAMADRLNQALYCNLNKDPEHVTWSDVGDASKIKNLMRQVMDVIK